MASSELEAAARLGLSAPLPLCAVANDIDAGVTDEDARADSRDEADYQQWLTTATAVRALRAALGEPGGALCEKCRGEEANVVHRLVSRVKVAGHWWPTHPFKAAGPSSRERA